MLTSHLHLPLKIRISGGIPLLPLYAFKAYKGTTLNLKMAAGSYSETAVTNYQSIQRYIPES
jgi:hypothetical protein